MMDGAIAAMLKWADITESQVISLILMFSAPYCNINARAIIRIGVTAQDSMLNIAWIK